MDAESKVFFSLISKPDYQENNSLYDLLTVEPAKPLAENKDSNVVCEFVPKSDKHYLPKRKSRLKVKTVRDIRKTFEQDIYASLQDDLEKQKSVLLHKIQNGLSSAESTKELAKKMLNDDCPISRQAWQMISNINPEEHTHSKQFVVWKSRLIQVNGSKGGRRSIIYNYDGTKISTNTNTGSLKKPNLRKQNKLLKNSLAVKFKPGPLRKKRFLDQSYQKHLGSIELVNLPSPILQIHPAYGAVLDQNIAHFVTNFRDVNGLMTKTWAEFAVSMLGTVKNKNIIQSNKESVLFELNYDRNKKRLLMRKDVEDVVSHCNKKRDAKSDVDDSKIQSEVQSVVKEIIRAVEMSLIQDSIFSVDEEIIVLDDVHSNDINNPKDKNKKRYSELDRLDVTVIKLPETDQTPKNSFQSCDKSFCSLGCVCDSLNRSLNIKSHCGLLDCMFQCKCKIPKYTGIEFLQSENCEVIPGLINLENKINSGLAKEEKKFHQTVIVSGEKSIVLKTQKRNRKATKRYAEYFADIHAVTEQKKCLTIIENKINCENIEPWCMVHNLYKCFCKGKFTESPVLNVAVPEIKDIDIFSPESPDVLFDSSQKDDHDSDYLKPRIRSKRIRTESKGTNDATADTEISSCARTEAYRGRKYTDGYYKHTHRKILEMEKNDVSLQNKMMKCVYKDYCDSSDFTFNDDIKSVDAVSCGSDNNCTEILIEDQSSDVESFFPKELRKEPSDRQQKLVTWLEKSYKMYKERIERGILKNVLTAPVKGIIALHPWEFILSRYRERKNMFIVSREKPFRIFIAISNKNILFSNCVNIDDIRFAELNNYPSIVKNLLTNATDLKNNFCILGGWDDCWEIVGSVTKMVENSERKTTELFDTEKMSPPDTFFGDKEISFALPDDDLNAPSTSKEENENDCTGRSKWFLMTLENDFTEIQVYKKGFYVKHASILEAIDFARISKKTVILSTQSCSNKSNGPQFGIYAIPNTSQFCVLVGPYEVDEPLGIEIVKNNYYYKKKRTRGVWILTNKVDDMKVIDNPMSFIPTKTEQSEMMLALGSNYNVTNAYGNSAEKDVFSIDGVPSNENTDSKESTKVNEHMAEIVLQPQSHVVKPIKIHRKNGYYKLININNTENNKNISLLPVTKRKLLVMPVSSNSSILNNTPADITPQLKITSVYSEKTTEQEERDKTEKGKGMFVLKPDEINKKLIESSMPGLESKNNQCLQMSTDEKFYVNSAIGTITTDEVLELSDEEGDVVDNNRYEMVWLQSNIENLGWIRGRRNRENMISFEFPGFKYSEFYYETEAFSKINQVLSRKIYVPKKFTVEWKVVQNKNELRGNMLLSEHLKENCILTKQGIKDIMSSLREKKLLKVYCNKNKPGTSSFNLENDSSAKLIDLQLLEKKSRILDDVNKMIWRETLSKESDIKNCLSISDDQKIKMNEALQNIIQLNEDDDND